MNTAGMNIAGNRINISAYGPIESISYRRVSDLAPKHVLPTVRQWLRRRGWNRHDIVLAELSWRYGPGFASTKPKGARDEIQVLACL